MKPTDEFWYYAGLASIIFAMSSGMALVIWAIN